MGFAYIHIELFILKLRRVQGTSSIAALLEWNTISSVFLMEAFKQVIKTRRHGISPDEADDSGSPAPCSAGSEQFGGMPGFRWSRVAACK